MSAVLEPELLHNSPLVTFTFSHILFSYNKISIYFSFCLLLPLVPTVILSNSTRISELLSRPDFLSSTFYCTVDPVLTYIWLINWNRNLIFLNCCSWNIPLQLNWLWDFNCPLQYVYDKTQFQLTIIALIYSGDLPIGLNVCVCVCRVLCNGLAFYGGIKHSVNCRHNVNRHSRWDRS